MVKKKGRQIRSINYHSSKESDIESVGLRKGNIVVEGKEEY
jgi:hypothetical protein